MMFVILSYDIGEKRAGKISRIAEKYLQPIQRSLYQGFLSENQLKKLKEELYSCIDTESDSVIFYKMQNASYTSIDEIGVIRPTDANII